MRIAIANDHAAVEARRRLSRTLRDWGFEVSDLGTDTEESVDYPDQAAAVARMVASGEADRGIILCGTGIGVSMAANKIDGIRAAVCHSVETATLAREHNDANVLCLGARVLDAAKIEACSRAFLDTAFAGGRHARRVQKIRDLEGGSGENKKKEL
ncbi:MAG: ribose 5-phosphate isomerase B [Planctomycetes bacterium]|nr:ribose 5-phosphate isomerase B [Planctomycetota bacterium]